MSLTCNLSHAQMARLTVLETDQPDTKVIGVYRGCPVLVHSGNKRRLDYTHISYLNQWGRLCGMGERARIIFKRR